MPCRNGQTLSRRKHGVVCFSKLAPPLLFSALLFGLCGLGAAGEGRACAPCPGNCSCAVQGTQCAVNCSGRGLEWSPAATELPTDTNILDLSRNHLSSVDSSLFDHLTGIKELYLQNNHITELPQKVFGCGSLAVLDLSNNQLTTIEGRICDNLFNLTTVDVSSNPFVCACKLVHLVSRLQMKGVTLRRANHMLCDRPPKLKDQPLLNVSSDDCELYYAGCLQDDARPGGSELVIFTSSVMGNFSREECNSRCFLGKQLYGGLGSRRECLCSANSEPNYISEARCSAACSNSTVMRDCGLTVAQDVFQVDFSVRVSAVRSSVHSEAVLSVSSSVLPVSLCWDFGDASPLLNTSVTAAQHKYGLPGRYGARVVATATQRETSGVADVRVELPPRLELHCPSLLLANQSLEEAVTLVNWGGVGVAVDWRIRKEGVEVARAEPVCVSDGVHHENSSRCFELVPGEFSWSEARRQCVARGGELAIARCDVVRSLIAQRITHVSECVCVVISPFSFAISDTSSFQPYLHGGIFRTVKTPKTYSFETMEQQLHDPQLLIPDLSKPEAPLQIHATMIALDVFQEQHNRLPNIGCLQDSDVLLKIAEEVNETLKTKVNVNPSLVRCVSRCARGCLSPLAAAVGGIASQEVLKALTGKFTPLQQWFYLDALEVVQPLQSLPVEEFAPRGDRYDALRACIGESFCLELHKLRVFMVGCGAIGCEMLKNFALLGVGLSRCSGEIFITDPDLIEKSNLNRQFLFRPHHIQKPKSITAAAVTLEINPELHIDANLHKVCPATEETFSDTFYSRVSLVITALDNVEARRYVDSRSVSNQKALLDSGTMGTKGHTEVIVPNLTESYNSHRDPPEEEIPFCTLKSFPAVIEHTIQWARDKFESSFSHKPSMFNVFWQTHVSATDVLQRMKAGESLDGAFQVIKVLSRRPTRWEHCLALARLKFDKYFKRKALQLLHSFPLDTRLKDGSLFWQSPKRPPSPIEFDLKDQLHFGFVVSAARLFAGIYNIPCSEKNLSYEAVASVLAEVEIPEYKPAEKHIETDETVKKPEQIKLTVSSEEEREAISQLEEAITSGFTPERVRMTPLLFEKDDDANGHMDFVESASALRARMYSIEAADRLQTKRIAGKIIPAIATATAAVAGLVALELIKVTGGYGFESFKNCFFNLAIPVMVLTETARVKRTQIRDDIFFSIWDRWSVVGHADFTLSDFISAVREKYGIEPTMVVHGVKMLYVPIMPGHSKRLKLAMQKLIKPSADRKYVDLTVSFAPETDGDEDLPGPPVRYHFRHESGEKA